LDFWPLGRTPWAKPGRADVKPPARPPTTTRATIAALLLEKVPLFVLAFAGAAITLITGRRFLHSREALSFSWRIVNAAHSYVIYIWMTFKPDKLAVYYPYRAVPYPLINVLLVAAVLIGSSVFCAMQWRR